VGEIVRARGKAIYSFINCYYRLPLS